jgi:hypothetical protein
MGFWLPVEVHGSFTWGSALTDWVWARFGFLFDEAWPLRLHRSESGFLQFVVLVLRLHGNWIQSRLGLGVWSTLFA